MAKTLKHRRGNAAQVAAFIPADGELVWDHENDIVYMGDGVTQGGIPIGNRNVKDGVVAIPANASSIQVTGLNLSFTPTGGTATVMIPSSTGDVIYAVIDISTLSTDGFTAYLNAQIPNSSNYKLSYHLFK